MIVAIDGPAGSGKSTVARLLAERLQIRYLDTGAMYRAIALAVVQSSFDENDVDAVTGIAQSVRIEFRKDDIYLNGTNVTNEIRSANVTAVASVVAANPYVRTRLVELQQQIATLGDLVTEGRDQGTVVFPQADHKFFVTASLLTRARRRHQEMVAGGSTLPLQTVKSQLRQRDHRDENREYAPMKPASDAQVIDTSDMSIGEVVNTLTQRIRPES
ncbi:MAG: (d)CMP kinase [Fuerstiella sp.]|nr:(d)CMP kinase [Fuerstiella sp.]